MGSLLDREIGERDVFGSEARDIVPEDFATRETVRAVIINSVGNVALVNASLRRIHFLVGGGIEKGEDDIAALRREALEEAGCVIDSTEYMGIIKERRATHLYISHCYIAEASEVRISPHYTLRERVQGCKLEWAQDIPTAIDILAANTPRFRDYRAHFISFRDRLILERAQKTILKKAE